jgi:signal transduction histidine kinase
MTRFWGTVTFRIALGYGALLVGSMAVISAVFYFGTVGVQARSIDGKLLSSSQSLANRYEADGMPGLEKEIGQLLDDGIDQDTEVYLLISPDGRKVAGNLTRWPDESGFLDALVTQSVYRYDRPSVSRLLPHRLPDGAILVVGRDLRDQEEISTLVWRALILGGSVALLLALGGALLFRRELGRNIATIRHTALEIQAGNLSRRIPVGATQDEFNRLSGDINGMLDRIEQLMDGVRHVSNTIAHNLRTPLGRIRAQLDETLRHQDADTPLSAAASDAIQEIDSLILVFEKLLQIAEAESGTRRRSFTAVALNTVVTDVVELYDAMAEAEGRSLQAEVQGHPMVWGDKDLLAVATANLVENAMKYAPGSKAVRVRASEDTDSVYLEVEDHGPGIPPEERSKVTERFYRLDSTVVGSGLGLSIVTAIAYLHQGSLRLEDAVPGLRVRIVLPRMKSSFPNGNPAESPAVTSSR